MERLVLRNDLKNRIHFGCPIDVATKDNYQSIRVLIQEIAGEYIDMGDVVRAQIALNEVKRLDEKFDFKLV